MKRRTITAPPVDAVLSAEISDQIRAIALLTGQSVEAVATECMALGVRTKATAMLRTSAKKRGGSR